MKHPKRRGELRPNEQWFFITLILTTNETFYRFHRNVKMAKDVQSTRNWAGLHLKKVVTIAKHACDHVLKWILKQSTSRLQIFLIKYEYLRSSQLCEDQGIRRKLKRNVSANMCLRFLQLIPRPGFKKMHKTFATVKKRLTAKI